VRYESGELAITRSEADAIHGVKLPAFGGAAGNGPERAATPVEEPAPRAATPLEEPDPEPEPKPQPKPKPKTRKVNSAVLDRLAAKPKAAAVLAVAEKKKKPKSKPLSSGFLNRMNKPMAGAR